MSAKRFILQMMKDNVQGLRYKSIYNSSPAIVPSPRPDNPPFYKKQQVLISCRMKKKRNDTHIKWASKSSGGRYSRMHFNNKYFGCEMNCIANSNILLFTTSQTTLVSNIHKHWLVSIDIGIIFNCERKRKVEIAVFWHKLFGQISTSNFRFTAIFARVICLLIAEKRVSVSHIE